MKKMDARQSHLSYWDYSTITTTTTTSTWPIRTPANTETQSSLYNTTTKCLTHTNHFLLCFGVCLSAWLTARVQYADNWWSQARTESNEAKWLAKYLAEVSDDRRRRRKFLLCAPQLLRVLSLMVLLMVVLLVPIRLLLACQKLNWKSKCAKCASVYCWAMPTQFKCQNRFLSTRLFFWGF